MKNFNRKYLKHYWAILKLFLSIFPLGVVISCAGTPKGGDSGTYPSEWGGPLVRDSNCSLISGIYLNEGITKSRSVDYLVTLDGAVFGMLPVRGETKFVRLDYIASRKKLRIELAGETIDPLHPSSNYDISTSCKNGWLVVDLSGSGYADGTYSKSNTFVNMAVSEENNNLIIRYTYNVVSTFVGFLKKRKSGESWYLFKRKIK